MTRPKRKTNADYRRTYRKRHPARCRKQDAAYYLRNRDARLAAANARHAVKRATRTEEHVKSPSPALLQARERFARQFKKDFMARIERQQQERMERPPSFLAEERDALILTLAAGGQAAARIAEAAGTTVNSVRAALARLHSKPEPVRPVQMELLQLEAYSHAS